MEDETPIVVSVKLSGANAKDEKKLAMKWCKEHNSSLSREVRLLVFKFAELQRKKERRLKQDAEEKEVQADR